MKSPFACRASARLGAALTLAACLSLSAVAGLSGSPVWAQQPVASRTATATIAATKRPITHDVYDSWRSIQGTRLSRDGNWIIYTLQPQDGDGELVVRNLKTNQEFRQPRGTGAVLTADGKFVVFVIAPTKAERDKAKKEKRPPTEGPKSGMGILTLATGKVETIDKVKRFSVSEDGSRFVAYQMEAAPAPRPERRPTDTPSATGTPPTVAPAGEYPEDNADFQQAGARRGQRAGAGRAAGAAGGTTKGSDLILRDLPAGTTTTIAEVTDFGWNKPGTRLAYTISGKETAKDGVYVREVEKTGDTPPIALLTGSADYKTPVFDDKGEQVAFLVSPKPEAKKPDTPAAGEKQPEASEAKSETKPEGTTPEKKDDVPAIYSLYLWQSGKDKAEQVVTRTTTHLPEGFVVSENATPRFSKDGQRLYFGTAPAPKPRPKDAPDPVSVDIWTSNDAILQPMQKIQAEAEKKRSFVAVWQVKDRKVAQLAAPDLPSVDVDEEQPNARYALGSSDLAYRTLASWDQGYRDVYLVDQRDGSRRKLMEKHGASASLSPDQKYLLYWNENEGTWYALPTDGKKPAVNLTAKLGVTFADEDHDTPDAAPPHGLAGWTEGDKSVLLYDRFDIWEVKPDGSGARNVTKGAGRSAETVLRYTRTDPEARTIPTDKPLLLAATVEPTKASGFYRLPALNQPDAAPTRLFVLDKLVDNLQKAKDADAIVFTESRFEEYPNLWVSNLTSLDKPNSFQRISDANPQQAEFVWGKSELIEYKTTDGKPLRAILTKPDNFDPSKKYPMIVYIYEKMTDGLHRYTSPAPGTGINFARFVSNGYIILRPDITYTTGYPGESAMKCVLPAVQAVVDRGYIDPARIGIQGHSWGAYQIAYLVTRTNRFRAVEAGAAVADMISAYGGIRWGSGMSRAFQYEKTQSRIGAPPWIKPLQYLENSPIFWVDKVQTPYLTIHNDADGAVPWEQGIEFFTALRRLGKEAYLFNYNGEDHNLRSRENMKHWTVHMDEFFDHYLLGAPRPEWMQKGVPYLERGTRDLSVFYNPKPEPSVATKAATKSSE